MKHLRKTMLVAGVLALGAAACFSDPTSSLRNGASRLNLSKTFVVLAVGDTTLVNVEVLDEQGNPQQFAAPTLTPVDAAVATAALQADTVKNHLPNGAFWGALIAGAGPGRTAVNVQAGGVTDSIIVLVFPTSFTGAVAPASVAEGDVITISSTPTVGFDPAATTATLGGVDAYIQSATASQLKIYAGAPGASQAVGLSNLLLLGQYPIGSLAATGTVTVAASAFEPGNDAPTGGAVITLPTTVGAYSEVIGVVTGAGACTTGGSDVDDFYTITSTTADSIEVRLDWANTSIDIDEILLNAAGTSFLNLSGATGADPETFKYRMAAATTYRLLVELCDASTAGVTDPIQYRLRIYKRN